MGLGRFYDEGQAISMTLTVSVTRASVHLERKRRALTYIDGNLHRTDLCPNDVAAALGISRRSLYLLFESGPSVAAQIRRRRMVKAHRMLTQRKYADMSVSQIAASVGLSSPAVFSRVFRAYYGAPPVSVRRAPRRDEALSA